MDVDELINKLYNINELINRNDLSVKTAELSNELLETLKIIENCNSCKDRRIDECDLVNFYESINKTENYLAKSEKGEQEEERIYIINELNGEFFEMNIKLNKTVLCEGCKEEIEKLTDKCGNEKIARFFYHTNKYNYYEDIQWISFDEFENIEFLAKGGFGEVHKAIWLNYVYYDRFENIYDNMNKEVVLKRIYNSSDKIIDILNEVK